MINIIADDMGLKNIVDKLRIDPLAWQRLDPNPRRQEEEKTEEEILFQAEGAENGEEGTPVRPADRFVPEQEQ